MNSLFMQGVDLMLLGMGFVFVFLVVLVFVMNFMSFGINRFFPEPIKIPVQKKAKKNLTQASAEEELIVAMSAASIHHKKLKGDK